MEVFVFDLDFTLWNAGDIWCSETNPPYVWEGNELFDQNKKWIRLYPDTIKVLETLQQHRKIIAAASRTYEPKWAELLLDLFNINKFFAFKEIYPGSKTKHLKRIQCQVNLPYDQIVFFDDEQRNIEETGNLGIKCVKINSGITFNNIQKFL